MEVSFEGVADAVADAVTEGLVEGVGEGVGPGSVVVTGAGPALSSPVSLRR